MVGTVAQTCIRHVVNLIGSTGKEFTLSIPDHFASKVVQDVEIVGKLLARCRHVVQRVKPVGWLDQSLEPAFTGSVCSECCQRDVLWDSTGTHSLTALQ